jgi:hypothetical protein
VYLKSGKKIIKLVMTRIVNPKIILNLKPLFLECKQNKIIPARITNGKNRVEL